MLYKLIIFILITIVMGCTNQNNSLEIDYIKGGKAYTDKIEPGKLITNEGKIQTDYIKQMSFEYIDSVHFLDNNPDKIQYYTRPVDLDFTKSIQKYSPEYYTVATAYYFDKAIKYYSRLFDNKINFFTRENYRTLKVLSGNYGLLSDPKQYILEENQLFSPSIFYHEVGHIAFWTLQDDLGIKFKGLSPLHVGLMEYFTVSLYNYPVVGELVLMKAVRDASLTYSYPQPDSMNLRRTMELIKESFPREIEDTNTFISKYYRLSVKSYDKLLDTHVDNHRGGFLYTSTLWRIREQLGQEKADKLVAQTILELNKFMEQRSNFYNPDNGEELTDKLMWYDLLYGLIKKDQELFEGAYKAIIMQEFRKSNFPIHKINDL